MSTSRFKQGLTRCRLCGCAALLALVLPIVAQEAAPASSSPATAALTRPAAPAPAPAADTTAAPARIFKPEEIQQLVALIALYPDALLTQILMAATYPLEVVQLQRWKTENASLQGDALAQALEKQPWDPSVKSLLDFPQVVEMLNAKLDWMVALGDAFIGQQNDLLDAIQLLRARARAQGNLESGTKQTVLVNQDSATPTDQTIVIESVAPETVYVPVYNPTTVYGTWPYPDYTPTYWYPAGYVARPGVAFGAGVACGVGWGYAWGNCDWHNRDIDIDIDRNASFNRVIDRDRYRNDFVSGRTRNDVVAGRTRDNVISGQTRDGFISGQTRHDSVISGQTRNNVISGQTRNTVWQHDATHRHGVAYRDPVIASHFGTTQPPGGADMRAQFRGRLEATGSGSIARAGALPHTNYQPSTVTAAGAAHRSDGGFEQRTQTFPRPQQAMGQSQARYNPSPQYDAYESRGSAFDGIHNGGAATRSYSDRGRESRAASSVNRPPQSRPAPSRPMGGGRRR